jgi:hypothetical protein
MNRLPRSMAVVGLVAALATVAATAVVTAAPGKKGQGPAFGKKGAIFTTNDDCTVVNQNQYELNEDVHVSGGPKKSGAASLLDGSFYVRVTQPNGKLLGTSLGSADETPFVVADKGGAVDCDQLAAIVVKASDGSAGFDLTGNPGGVYKVWVCKTAEFTNRTCKKDNFKSNEGLDPDDDDDDDGEEEPDPT